MTAKLTIFLIVVYVVLAISSARERAWAKALYWFGAAILTYGVLRMK